jgi:hypothetical protein
LPLQGKPASGKNGVSILYNSGGFYDNYINLHLMTSSIKPGFMITVIITWFYALCFFPQFSIEIESAA